MSSDKNCLLIGETCRTNRIGERERKETEKFGRGEGGFLMKKTIRWVWLAYRELIRILEDWYRKGV